MRLRRWTLDGRVEVLRLFARRAGGVVLPRHRFSKQAAIAPENATAALKPSPRPPLITKLEIAFYFILCTWLICDYHTYTGDDYHTYTGVANLCSE